MSEQENESRPVQIQNALSEIYGKDGELLSRWVLISESLSEDGREMEYVTSENLQSWEGLGLIRAVDAILADDVVATAMSVNYKAFNSDEEDDEDE